MNQEISFKEEIIRASSNNLSKISSVCNKQQEAIKKISETDFPNKKQEDWKYFDTKDILELNYFKQQSEKDNSNKLSKINELIKAHIFPETTNRLIVTLNGEFNQELSNFKATSKELLIGNFNQLEANITDYFAKTGSERFFKLCNTALMKNAFMLSVAEGHKEKEAIQILHISETDSFNQLRSLIHLSKNSSLDLIVTYVGIEGSSYLTNAVIETQIEDGAELTLSKVQDCSKKSTHLYDFSAELLNSAKLSVNTYNFGAQATREDINVDINGSGSHAEVNGLYVLNGERKSHHRVVVKHNVENSSSAQLFKGLLEDSSRAEFNGLIEVARDAQKTDATQLNNNILLSDDAHVDSRPQLDILADDVKCAHGSTTGRADDDALFYLQSRGIDEASAKTILTYSFCQEVIDKIKLKSAQNYAANLAYRSMSPSHRTRTGQESKTINILASK